MKEYVRAYSPQSPRQRGFNWKFVLVCVLSWVALVHFYERWHPRHVINRCQWDQWEAQGVFHHRVAIVADPQIIDDYSYPKFPRWFQRLFEFVADNFLRRNHLYTQNELDPDSTIFLGDLFDGGREWNSTQLQDTWFKEYKRFDSIYPLFPNRRHYLSVAGNHDIGFEGINVNVSRRFAQFYGEPNGWTELGNHTIIWVDTISLSHPDPEVAKPASDFLDTVVQSLPHPEYPRILLTHVPLYRWPDRQTCGPLRERNHKLFPLMKGYQYQTVIEYQHSQRLLSTIGPVLVLAGDDHDYCDIIQEYAYNGGTKYAREITVKAASMTGGVRYPAIQLLSLHGLQGGDSSYSTQMCFMPTPYLSLKAYAIGYGLSVFFLTLLYLTPGRLNHFTKRTNQLLNDTNMKRRWYYWVDEEPSTKAFVGHLIFATIVPAVVYTVYVRSLY
ncbi:cell division control protein 1 [Diutina catenulata]